MLRNVRLAPVWILMVGFMATGCQSARIFNGEAYRVDKPWWDPRTEKLSEKDAKESLINLATYCFAEDLNVPQREAINGKADSYPCKKFAYDRAKENAIDRDRLQDVLIAASNRECDIHLSSVMGTNTGVNLSFAMLSSLFTGAATGFTAASTKTALSGLATFANASRAQINEQVYRQLFVGTVLAAIGDDRHAQWLEIADRRRYPIPNDAWDDRTKGRPVREKAPPTQPAAQQSSTTQNATTQNATTPSDSESATTTSARQGTQETRQFYSVDEAIRDAEVYHQRCSFYSGLVGVATKVEQFSPCRIVQERRERLLAELSSMNAAKTAEGIDKKRFDAYSKELESLNTKAEACSPATAK